ncbi:MAG: ATPase, T2SS/T4P/T4SS family [Absicoccus porci]|jgi:competence protein ComGA|uniref:Flp pilus assembly complex ATPase component TadA n=1 Tax=Absicoccus intestinalis TaxID=2926319 RepID=A0ABU4WJP6_9FIRM|nr:MULTISPECIES: ATPase, T2SS/T4P/T4SS family [Absicoccus]MCI6087458.1 Flp pilus assembly complex ATPase component TadA [Absicoccus porci]MDD6459840.1 ATPase, T2SS/T4P/T4SS family [Absicoccus porci]MDD7331016.1 ATPase, T2SS/T4P/T4SS family [Absicoccus porci]MDX8416777.1 Flp pilus assembly complex ATPase component TadA [Absicoccus sp. CLA-KB-P134]MDY4738913.1 ATPase, T2SS/T4P/T4SS family [Absicoccus porci]
MEELLDALIQLALDKRASDIHFTCSHGQLHIQLRTMQGLIDIDQNVWKPAFFEFLKFHARFDLTNPWIPQSGQFVYHDIFCRFSVIYNHDIQTGVLRLLHTQMDLKIEDLTLDVSQRQFLHQLTTIRQGLVLCVGPTNSGKTTTLHAILHEIALNKRYKVVSLEDPIEIDDPSYLQLEINPSQGFTYECGIEELLRHDPDVILIGETRNSYTAKMVIRAALTGHMVFTTLHAKNGKESISRMMDFGIAKYELKTTLTAILAQRLYMSSASSKQCIYELLTGKELRYVLENDAYSPTHITLDQAIRKALIQGDITDKQAELDIQDLKG